MRCQWAALWQQKSSGLLCEIMNCEVTFLLCRFCSLAVVVDVTVPSCDRSAQESCPERAHIEFRVRLIHVRADCALPHPLLPPHTGWTYVIPVPKESLGYGTRQTSGRLSIDDPGG